MSHPARPNWVVTPEHHITCRSSAALPFHGWHFRAWPKLPWVHRHCCVNQRHIRIGTGQAGKCPPPRSLVSQLGFYRQFHSSTVYWFRNSVRFAVNLKFKSLTLLLSIGLIQMTSPVTWLWQLRHIEWEESITASITTDSLHFNNTVISKQAIFFFFCKWVRVVVPWDVLSDILKALECSFTAFPTKSLDIGSEKRKMATWRTWLVVWPSFCLRYVTNFWCVISVVGIK